MNDDETLTIATVETQEQIWQGPLPSPQSLTEFQAVLPDAPERIMRQWEEESAHRRAYEIEALRGAIGRDRRGQHSAIAFAIGALLLAGWGLYLGYEWVSGIIGSGTIASVVGAFLYQRKPPRSGK